MSNDLYHCCNWCKHYNNACYNEIAFYDTHYNTHYDFTRFQEDGFLSEAIEEGFTKHKFSNVIAALVESKLSKKKIKEIVNILGDELETTITNWSKSIDNTVSTAMNNFEFETLKGIDIQNPSEFYCRYFE